MVQIFVRSALCMHCVLSFCVCVRVSVYQFQVALALSTCTRTHARMLVSTCANIPLFTFEVCVCARIHVYFLVCVRLVNMRG